jgi:RNA polymerase sigma-70 factor (ECF subfamily)
MTTENLRLSRIATRWSLVCKAHSGPCEAARAAQLELLKRYGGAIDRYLLAALRDPEAAEELSQEFALRFIRGDFRGVDPLRGRFRDYVKTVLFRLVAQYYKRRNLQPRSLPGDVADPNTLADQDREFLDSWKCELLQRAWSALEEVQRKKGHPYHTVLRFSFEHSDDGTTSAALAERLSGELGRTFTAAGVRKILQRARAQFAQFLLEDVAHSLESATAAQLEQELRQLGLLAYCRPALEDWDA